MARDGHLIESSCQPGVVKVRPVRGAYPPKVADAVPDGYTIEYKIAECETLKFHVSAGVTLVDIPGYYRYMGTISGGKVNGEKFHGRALGEQFALAE